MAETRKWLRNADDGSHSLAEDSCASYSQPSFLIMIGCFAILNS